MAVSCFGVVVVAIAAVLLATLAPAQVAGYSTGAQSAACAGGFPGGMGNTNHGTMRAGNGGFSLSFSPALSGMEYSPGQTYTVTVEETSLSVNGFLIYTQTGSLGVADAGNTKTGPCSGADSITHRSELGGTVTVTFQWTAPNSGDATIRTTVLVGTYGSDYYIFNTQLSTSSGTDCSTAPDCTALDRDACEAGDMDNTCGACIDGFYESNGMRIPKNTDSCEVCNGACSLCEDATTACTECATNYEFVNVDCVPLLEKNFTLGSKLRSPGCTDDATCPVVARWGREGSVMNFEITIRGFSNVDWAGIGFNTDEPEMEECDILTAYMDPLGAVSVVNRFATSRSFPAADADQSGISRVGGSRNGEVFTVEFSRSLSPINANDASFLAGAEDKFVVVAFGENDISEHGGNGEDDGPILSSATVDLRSTASVQSSTANNASFLVALHGTILMLAWILLAPSATVIAHNLRFTAPLWFKLHRNMQVLAVLLTIAGVAIIFVELGELEGSLHAWLGLGVLAIAVIQFIIGFARNKISKKDPDSTDPSDHGPRRWLFNYMHWFLGAGGLILAIVVMYLGLDLFGTGDNRVTIFYVWIGVDGVVALLSTVMKRDEDHAHPLYLVVTIYVAASAAAVVTIAAILFNAA